MMDSAGIPMDIFYIQSVLKLLQTIYIFLVVNVLDVD